MILAAHEAARLDSPGDMEPFVLALISTGTANGCLGLEQLSSTAARETGGAAQ